MANEAILRVRLDHPIDMTVADGAGIEKGTVCKLGDPLTAEATDDTGDIFAGIAAREKVASDGRTRLSIFRRGIFDMTVNSGVGVTMDTWVTSSGANLIRDATEAEVHAGKGIGIALETGSASEVINVLVGGY